MIAIDRRSFLGGTAAVVAGGLLTASPVSAAPATTRAPARPARLTNLAHLDYLSTQVAVTDTAAHSTYRLAQEPTVGVLWVYADPRPGNTFERVGGGAYDAASNTWGQGAFDADDIARAAVVYLRQWQATGDTAARTKAYQQLRGLAYFQTLTGAHAGEAVLWMQPDGSLNPTPTPPDSPNPADTGPSYWLARSLWAFGEGFAAFRRSDPAFAAFLRSRMDLAVTALHRDVLIRYGTYQVIHGVEVPAWLIVDGADASSEAMLGLAAYVTALGAAAPTAAVTALAQLSAGVSRMAAGTTATWPYRALLPWALSRSDWHAWGAQMSAGLAAASTALHDPSLLSAAIGDAAGFTPHLLTATGPDNGWLPTPIDRTQIAYGADARVQSVFAVASATGRAGLRTLAGITAGWFFGQNAAGVPVYDPATGVTNDGVAIDGTVNKGSGAESTIHGLLTMQLLDAHPDVAAVARSAATVVARHGQLVVEAESGARTGDTAVVTPASEWTGESSWSAAYVAVGAGSTVSWSLPADDQPRLVQPVVELVPGSAARTTFRVGPAVLGTVRYGTVGVHGNAPSPTQLQPVELSGTVPVGPATVTASTTGGTGNLDALLVTPLISRLALTGQGSSLLLLSSMSTQVRYQTVDLPGSGPLEVRTYDRDGRAVRSPIGRRLAPGVPVAPGGFTIVTR